MHNVPHKTLMQLFHNHLERIHSLPEHIRRIFMVITMIFATTFVGLFSWLLFPPLQNLNLPSLDTNQQKTNYNEALDNLSKVAHDNEFADVSKIIDISPASGFMESFQAMKDLIVPKNVKNNFFGHIRMPSSWHIPPSLPQSWSAQLSGALASITLKLRQLFALIFERLQELWIYTSNIVISSLSYVISQISYALSYVSHILSRVLHTLSYIASVPSYLSHVLDVLISFMSRTAK